MRVFSKMAIASLFIFLLIPSLSSGLAMSTAKLICYDVAGYIAGHCRITDAESGQWVNQDWMSDIFSDDSGIDKIRLNASRCTHNSDLELQIVVSRSPQTHCTVTANPKGKQVLEVMSMMGILDDEVYSNGMDQLESLLVPQVTAVGTGGDVKTSHRQVDQNRINEI